MTDTELAHTRRTPEDIGSWLVERVAYYLERPAAEIDPDQSVADYGLDSVFTFALCGEIEDTLGLAVEPTLIWDFDTLTALTAHLSASVCRTTDESND
jgi:acyl carrier protein